MSFWEAACGRLPSGYRAVVDTSTKEKPASNSIKVKGGSPAPLPPAESPFAVALELFSAIYEAEAMHDSGPNEEALTSPRKYQLDLYAECIAAVQGQRSTG